MRIRHPSYRVNGKIIIEYKGTNINPFYCSSSIENVVLYSRLEIYHSTNDFVLEFKIQDGTKVRYCVSSKNIYLEENNDWVFFEESKFIKCEILQNDGSIYFLGCFSFIKFLDLGFAINETYSFTAFFDKNSNFTGSLIKELSHAKLI
jgi:hypothetical protein